MKTINKYKTYIIIGIIILLMIVLSLLIYKNINNDGMNNHGIYNIKYRVVQNDRWSKYSHNGMLIGDKKNPIQNLELKYNNKKGSVYYNVYTKDWSEQVFNSLEKNTDQIYGIKINISDVLYKKYTVCYRTYNKKDKWLNWTCTGTVSGNKEEPITAIEIKIIPKKSVKGDYLKDYNKKLEFNTNF